MKQYTFYVMLSSVALFNGALIADQTQSTSTPMKITIEKQYHGSVIAPEQEDNLISTQVRDLLRTDRAFSEDKITISTKDHVVTLKGTVMSEEGKKSLGDKAQSIKGVTSVNNDLEVQSQGK